MPPESRSESELTIPTDLISEVQNQLPVAGADFQIEGWKPSIMSRMFGFLDRRLGIARTGHIQSSFSQ